MATQVKKTTTNTTAKVVKPIPTKEEDKILSTEVNKTVDTLKDKEIEQLKKENQEKDNKLEELSKNFAAMQAQFELLIKSNMNNSQPLISEDEDILVGCRAIYGAVLATNDGKYVYKFECDEERYISSEDLRTIFKESGTRDNKKLFEEDIFYFVDKENYSKFKIRKRIDLSHENIVRILTITDPVKMIDEINKITNHLIDFPVVHAFQFEVVKMLIDKKNPLFAWKYENRVALERYLGQKFDDLMAAVGAVELLGRKKFN